MKSEQYLTTLLTGIKEVEVMIGSDNRFKQFLEWVLEIKED